MNILWIVAGVTVAWTTVEGVRQGVVRRAVELVGLVLVFLFASRLADLLAPRLEGVFGIGSSAGFYASWGIVLVGGIVAVRLAAAAVHKLVHLTLAGWIDRGGGGVLGLAFGLVLASCLFLVAYTLPLSDDLRDEIDASEPARLIMHVAPSLYDAGREALGGERFFDMIEEHVKPAAESLRERAAEAGERIPDVGN